MEKQSKTIGGVLSTIEGNFDEFLKNLFAAESGPMKRFVDLLEQFSRGLQLFSLTEDQIIAKGNEIIKDNFKTKAKEFADSIGDVVLAEILLAQQAEANILKLEELNDEIARSDDFNNELYDSNLRTINQHKQHIVALTEMAQARREERIATNTKELQADLEAEAKAKAKLLEIEKKLRNFREEDEGKIDVEFGSLDRSEWDETLRQLEEFGDALFKEIEDQGDEQLKLKQEQDQDEIEAEKRKQEQIKDLRRQAFDFGIDLLGQFLMAATETGEIEYQREKDNFDRRLNAAGNNERARQEIEAERLAFEEEQRKKQDAAETEQAKRDKERMIKQMIIQGVMNTIRALGNPPVPNFGLAAITGFANTASIGIAKGIGFREGGYTGEGQLDEVAGVVHKREFVVRAENVPGSRQLLEAVQDRSIDDRILHKLNPAQSGGSKVDMSGVERRLDKIAANTPDYYEHGVFVNKVIKKGESLTQHTRAKYGFKK